MPRSVFLAIMLELCLMLLLRYYSRKYYGIIIASLERDHYFGVETRSRHVETQEDIVCVHVDRVRNGQQYLTLGAHAPEGYGSFPGCVSVCLCVCVCPQP